MEECTSSEDETETTDQKRFRLAREHLKRLDELGEKTDNQYVCNIKNNTSGTIILWISGMVSRVCFSYDKCLLKCFPFRFILEAQKKDDEADGDPIAHRLQQEIVRFILFVIAFNDLS